eukprot:4977717-Prymnesium_polylepis.1
MAVEHLLLVGLQVAVGVDGLGLGLGRARLGVELRAAAPLSPALVTSQLRGAPSGAQHVPEKVVDGTCGDCDVGSRPTNVSESECVGKSCSRCQVRDRQCTAPERDSAHVQVASVRYRFVQPGGVFVYCTRDTAWHGHGYLALRASCSWVCTWVLRPELCGVRRADGPRATTDVPQAGVAGICQVSSEGRFAAQSCCGTTQRCVRPRALSRTNACGEPTSASGSGQGGVMDRER